MHHAAVVRVLQPGRCLANEIAGDIHRQAPSLFHERGKVGPFDMLHRQNMYFANLLCVVRRYDIGMRELRGSLHFTTKAVDDRWFGKQFFVDHFQCDAAIHQAVFRLVDVAHAAPTQRFHRAIARMAGEFKRYSLTDGISSAHITRCVTPPQVAFGAVSFLNIGRTHQIHECIALQVEQCLAAGLAFRNVCLDLPRPVGRQLAEPKCGKDVMPRVNQSLAPAWVLLLGMVKVAAASAVGVYIRVHKRPFPYTLVHKKSEI